MPSGIGSEGLAKTGAHDGLRNFLRRSQDFAGWNTKHRDTALAQPFVAGCIALRTASHIVRDPLDLDAELRCGTVEIEHVRPERVLPAELDLRLLAQFLP